MGWLRGAPWGKPWSLPYPPVAVQSLNSPIISVFVQSHSHSSGHRFSSGSENHARSQLRHPLSAPESRTLSVTRKYRPQRCPFRFRVPTAVEFFKKNLLHKGREMQKEKQWEKNQQNVLFKESFFAGFSTSPLPYVRRRHHVTLAAALTLTLRGSR